MNATTRSPHILRRLVSVLLGSGVLASLLLAVPGLKGVTTQIAHLDGGWLVAAVALEFGSCLAFVVIFRSFFNELPSGPGRKLAWVEQGAGALLPGGGVGALAVGGWLLRQRGLSKRRIIERSSGLFFLTSAVNIVALVGAGALLATGLSAGPDDPLRSVAPIVVIGYLANLIPIPGGFGVLEGGLAGALVAYHAPATQAAAAVVVYHAIAFWIPGLGGLLGYFLLRDQSHMLALRRRRALRAAQAAAPKRSSTAAALAS